MATVSVVLGYRASAGLPLMLAQPRAAEPVTSGAVSVQSNLVAETNEIWEVACDANALWVKFGSNPTAAAGDQWYVPAGVPRNFQAKAGEKIALINA